MPKNSNAVYLSKNL